MVKAIFLGDQCQVDRVWGPEQRARLRKIVEIEDQVWRAEDLVSGGPALREVEAVFSTWGMPRLEQAALDAMPALKVVFYAAGSVRHFAEPLWERGVRVASAWVANGVPVAEFTLAQVILGLKQAWAHAEMLRREGPRGWRHLPMNGVYGASVGIVSLGVIGRRVVESLRPLQLKLRAYDPYVDEARAASMGVELVSLESIFASCEVVTLHTPWLKETEGLVTGALIESMKPGATLINTSRGAVIDEPAMIEVLERRTDLTAVLDVTHPEPPVEGSPLYRLPNVILTPHIAGSCGMEVRRMADWMVEECEAWRQGLPLRYAVTAEMAARMA